MENIKLTIKDYLLIFILALIAGIFLIFIKNLFYKDTSDNAILLHNLKEVNNKINTIEEIVKLNASKVKLKDRLDSKLVEEFRDDEEFLSKVASLKKQIIKRKLESEVVQLENERIARNNKAGDGDIYSSPFDKKLASKIFDIMMINSSAGTAVVRFDDALISIKEKDNIKGFIVRKIDDDAVIMGRKDGDDEVLRLNYLTSTLYDKGNKKDDENKNKK